MRKNYKQGLIDAIPTMLGYLSISFACGVYGRIAGMTVFEIALASILLYAGSGQFILAAMFAVRASILSIIITIFLVNLRHLLLSSSVAGKMEPLSTPKAFLLGYYLTDETFGVAINCSQNQSPLFFKWMLGVNMSSHICWVAGNITGAICASFISNPGAIGLDFAVSAMFISILAILIKNTKNIKKDLSIVLVTVAAALSLALLKAPNVIIIVSTVIGAAFGTVIYKCK